MYTPYVLNAALLEVSYVTLLRIWLHGFGRN